MAFPKDQSESANTQDPRAGSEPVRGRGGRVITRRRNDNPLREPRRNNNTGRGATHSAGSSRTSTTPTPAPTLRPEPNKKRPSPDPEEGQPESQRARVTVSHSNPMPSPFEVVPLGRKKTCPTLANTISGEAEPPVIPRSRSNQLPSPFEAVSLGRNTNSRRGTLQADLNASDSTEWRTLRPNRKTAPTLDEAPSSHSLDSRAPSATGLIRSGSTPKRDAAFIKQPRLRTRNTPQPETQTKLGAEPEPDVQSEIQARVPQGTLSKTSMSRGSGVPVEDAEVWNGYHERYEQLKLVRDQQRAKAIGEGSMTDPAQRTSLKQAITPVGTCTAMCPEFERIERIVQKMVDKSEKYLHPGTGELQNLETKMIKRFRRSAAGYDEQLPSDIRTPETLLQTLNYILRNVIGGDEPLGVVHKFVWDRTRSIRNDLSIQQLTEEKDVRIAVKCLERIARFHILSLHLLVSPANTEPFSAHQDREQLNNALLSLLHFYDDNRGRIEFENEDEFRSYYIVFSIQDQRPDLEARIQRWPSELRRGPQVQVALELFAAAGNTWEYQGTLDAKRHNAIAQGFYSRFFQILDSECVSYLLACVAEIYFNNVRQTAIRSIWRAYRRHPRPQQHKNEEWTVDEIRDALYFDSDEEVRDFCERQLLVLSRNSEGKEYLNWGQGEPDSTDVPPSSTQAFSGEYVEPKRCGRSLVAVILGKSVAQAAQSGMIDPSLLAEPLPSQLRADAESSEAPGESLFVSDDEEREEIMDESEPETRMAGQTSRQVFHWLEDTESGLLPLSPTGRPDEDLRNTPDGANTLTVPDDQTTDHGAQFVDSSMPAASPDVAFSQGRGTAAGSRDRRIGPFLVSPSPSPPPSSHSVPNKEQSESFGPGSQEPAGSSQILGSGTNAHPDTSSLPASTTSGPSIAPALSEVQDVASAGTQQSTSDAAAPIGPMTVAAPVAGSFPQSDNREPTGISAPAVVTAPASAPQSAALSSAMQVPGPAAAVPNASMFGDASRRTETRSVGNSLESGGLNTPMPDTPDQFSKPAAPFPEQIENASYHPNPVQYHVETAVPSYLNPNGEQFEEYTAAQALNTHPDSTVVIESAFYPWVPTGMSMQANDVEVEMKESPTTLSSMPSNGWVVEQQRAAVAQDAVLPRPEIGLFGQPVTNGVSAVYEESGPVQGPVPAYTTSVMEASPAVPAEVRNIPLSNANLEKPPVSLPPSQPDEVRPVDDSTPVEPTSSRTDSIPLGEQLEASPSEPLSSAPAVTCEGPMVPSKPVAAPFNAVTPPAAITDQTPATEKGSWLSSEQVNKHGWRGFLFQVARERREAQRQEAARPMKRALEGEENEVTMGSRKAARASREEVSPTVPEPRADVRVSPVAAEKAVVTSQPPPPAAPIVDQDELLLSAARVTADALAKGSHLWDSSPSPRTSLRPVHAPITEPASRNASSPGKSRIRVNGYEVALAPESPLGLGRSLSRTEQRIRKTGARGLASRAFSWNPDE